jgi:drug/metabolite transporter (DMT)-like permease
VVYGLVAAVAWGASAVAAAAATRRTGTYIAVLCAQGAGLVLLLALIAIIRPSFAGTTAALAAALAGCGLASMLGYVCYYRAVKDGPVGLVSAISATYGGIAALLAVIVLGERLTAPGAAGVVLAVAGVALAIAAPRQPAAGSVVAGRGVAGPAISVGEPVVGPVPAPARLRSLPRGATVPLLFAAASAVAYGLGGFGVGDLSARAGWLGAALIAHSASVLALTAALPFLGRPAAWRGTGRGVRWAAGAGLADAVGLLAFTRGGQVGQVAVTAAISSVFPVIPLVAGVVMFGERLGRRQLLGTGVIIAGLILLGMSG